MDLTNFLRKHYLAKCGYFLALVYVKNDKALFPHKKILSKLGVSFIAKFHFLYFLRLIQLLACFNPTWVINYLKHSAHYYFYLPIFNTYL